jgi:antitoxin (DNA-binding transcriptional repressor) of toxin-antitoxin stability system
MAMTRVGTAELKANLSKHLRAVRAGETLIVLDRQTPVARVIPFEAVGSGPSVSRGTGRLRDFVKPPPLDLGVSVEALLAAERAERP